MEPAVNAPDRLLVASLGTAVGAADARRELEGLLDHYQQSLFGFLVVLLADGDTAHDCMQETFLRAYENLRAGKPVNAAWLYKVARNRATDELRRRQRERRSQDGIVDVPDAVVHDDNVNAVQRALLRLSPGDREVLYLAEVDGFTSKEIGSMLGARAGAVRMRLMRAHVRFREAFRAEA
jgi:RNA polymerase sigma-70 factor (ECF subfamily)